MCHHIVGDLEFSLHYLSRWLAYMRYDTTERGNLAVKKCNLKWLGCEGSRFESYNKKHLRLNLTISILDSLVSS